MALITKIKAGAISSLSDARFFAGMGVDWLGFNVDPDANDYVSLDQYKNFVGWVSGPQRVAEISAVPDDQLINSIITDYVPDFIEVNLPHAELLPANRQAFVRAQIGTIDLELLARVAPRVAYLVLDLGNVDPWSVGPLLTQIADPVPVLLSIKPDQRDARKLVAELPVAGFALQGSRELKTGLKEYDYSALLESLEAGD